MHYDFFLLLLASTVICDVLSWLEHMRSIVCGFPWTFQSKHLLIFLIIIISFLHIKIWTFFFHFLICTDAFCFADSDGEGRHGVHAGQRQTRGLDGKAGQPVGQERLLHRHVSSGGPEVLIDGSTPLPPWMCDRGGGGDRVTAGGENRDVNSSDSLNRDIDPLLSFLLLSICWAWLLLPAVLQQTPPQS